MESLSLSSASSDSSSFHQNAHFHDRPKGPCCFIWDCGKLVLELELELKLELELEWSSQDWAVQSWAPSEGRCPRTDQSHTGIYWLVGFLGEGSRDSCIDSPNQLCISPLHPETPPLGVRKFVLLGITHPVGIYLQPECMDQ